MIIKELKDVTRVTIVAPSGVIMDKYNTWRGVELHLQDDGRTLKLFPLLDSEEDTD